MMVQHYRQLKVWQKAMELAKQCYRVTKLLPTEERYGLTSQIRRAAVSVPANIAEGHGRFHTREYLHHLGIARGSLAEVETLLLLSLDVDLLSEGHIKPLLALSMEVSRMTAGLRKSLEEKIA